MKEILDCVDVTAIPEEQRETKMTISLWKRSCQFVILAVNAFILFLFFVFFVAGRGHLRRWLSGFCTGLLLFLTKKTKKVDWEASIGYVPHSVSSSTVIVLVLLVYLKVYPAEETTCELLTRSYNSVFALEWEDWRFAPIYYCIISIKAVFMMLIWILVFWWQLSYSFRESGARKSWCPSDLLLGRRWREAESVLSSIGASSDEIRFWVRRGSTSVLLRNGFMANWSGLFSDGSIHKGLSNGCLLPPVIVLSSWLMG